MIFLRRWAWLIFLFVFTFSALFSSGVDSGSSHDKLKYLGIAWSMYHSGHYFIPQVNGVFYTDKPPLIFWLIAMVWHIFGVNMFALQCLINFLVASWAFLLRACYATIFPKDELGKNLIPYVLIGSYAVWRDFWFLRVDLLLLTAILMCNLGILKLLMQSASEQRWPIFLIATGCCIGLFSKGPVVYIFTLLPLLVSSLVNRHNRRVFSKIIIAILVGTIAFLAVWAIPASLLTNPDFATQIFYKQISHRAVAPVASSSNKHYLIYVYDYIPMLILPWIMNIIFFKKIQNIFKEKSPYRSFLYAVIIIPIIFFTVYGQKSLWYILPIIPFVLLYLTRFFVEYRSELTIIRYNRYVFCILFGVVGIVFLAFCFSPVLYKIIFKNFDGQILPSCLVTASIAFICLVTSVYLFYSKSNLTQLVFIVSLMMAIVAAYATTYFVSFVKPLTHIDQVGVILREQDVMDKGIVLYNSPYYLGQFSYAARLSDFIPSIQTSRALTQWLQQYPQGIVITNAKNCPTQAGLHPIAFYQERRNVDPYRLCTTNHASIISLRKQTQYYQEHMAHPVHSVQTVNIDVESGQVLQLSDLFTDQNKALEIMAAYSELYFLKRLALEAKELPKSTFAMAVDMIKKGTKSDVKNFSHWNVVDGYLQIIFERAQVRPSYYGEQTLDIPLSLFSTVLNKKLFPHVFQLKPGDLLFQDLVCGAQCDGINSTTYGYRHAVVSHVGMVVSTDKKQPMVIEAVSTGVKLTQLNEFLLRTVDSFGHPRVMVGRVDKTIQPLISSAVKVAMQDLGLPYNPTFSPAGQGFYCSQLITHSFMEANHGKTVFALHPMNFKLDNSDTFSPAWIQYFAELNQPIPQGQPGNNPGLLSRDPHIKIIYFYGQQILSPAR